MFLMTLVFVVVLLLTFAVVLLLTRPTADERVIEDRISRLRAARDGLSQPDDAEPIVKRTEVSEVPWLDALLRRCKFVDRVQLLIAQAESSWSAAGVLASTALLGVAGYGLGWYEMGSAVTALVPALALAPAPFVVLQWRRHRRLKAFNRHLAEAIDLLSRALRAGHSLAAAIEIAGDESPEPVRTEFREVYRQQNFGLPAREALTQLAQRVPLPELNFLVTAMLLQRETGGNLVEILDRTSGVIRERLRIQGEIRIYTAQGRLTGLILSLLPVAMFFLLGLANREYTRVLIEDPLGRKLVYAGLSLMILGGLTIRKVVSIKV